jgi:cell division protein FtsQ
VRATLSGLGAPPSQSSPLLVHFGDSDFSERYHLLVENVDQWRTSAGRVDSVDLRFARQVVVNPEDRTIADSVPQAAPQRTTAVKKRR